MWLLPILACLTPALASDAEGVSDVEPPPTEDLELQVQDEVRLADHYYRATRTGHIGAVMVGVGALGTAAGVGLFLVNTTPTQGAGVVLLVGGIGSMLVGPPLLLGASIRANSMLRERGVFSGTAPAVSGWTLLGTMPIAALSGAASGGGGFVVLGSVWYLGAIGCGLLQLELNRRAAVNAGVGPPGRVPVDLAVVPTLNGARLVGRF